MSDFLLETKLHLPPPGPELVPRPQLWQRLNEGLWGGAGQFARRLTLVSAPAGFGKTTVVAEWMRSCATPVAWLSLEEGDSDPARFFAYVVAALQRALPQLQAPSPAPAAQPPMLTTRLGRLLNQIASLGQPVVLALDDYQAIQAAAVHEALAWALAHFPPSLHLVLITRSDPPLRLARLRARRQLLELRQGDLRFAEGEAARFLQEVAGLALTTDEVAILNQRTEGWVSGLQMAALALQARLRAAGDDDRDALRQAEMEHFIRRFAGSDRYIMDYLLEEVWQQQPAPVQAFLLHTSILDRMCAPLCQALWEPAGDEAELWYGGAQELLEYLEAANLFILSLDNERKWYRYHRLFADLLRKRLQQTASQLAPLLHRRASVWYEGQGQLAQAIDHALAGEQYAEAAALLLRRGEVSLMRSELATLLRWLEALPPEQVRAEPRLISLQAGALLLSGSSRTEVEALLTAALSMLGKVEDSQERNALKGELAVYQALLAVYKGQTEQGKQLARKAQQILPPERAFLRNLATEILGFAHTFEGDAAAAEEAFAAASEQGGEAGDLLIAVGALCNRAGLAMARGELDRSQRIYEEALALATDEHGQRLPIAGKALLGLGELCRERDDLDAAARYLHESMALFEGYADIGPVFALLSLARVRQGQGEMSGAQRLVDEAAQRARTYAVTDIDDSLVELYQLQLWLATGQVPLASRWARQQEKAAEGEPVAQMAQLQEAAQMTLARVYLAEERPAEAVALLQPPLRNAEEHGQLGRALKIRVLLAMAQEMAGAARAALDSLEPALRLGARQGYVRSFLDEGIPAGSRLQEALASLLYRAAAAGIVPEYTGRLLGQLSLGEAPRPAGQPLPQSDVPSPMLEPLSDRELEVLQLIAAGLSNREIGERLFISLSTVKGHNSNIYGKLGVGSRTEAVARAQALGVL